MNGMSGFVARKAGQIPQASQGVNQGQPRSTQNASVQKLDVPVINRSNMAQARNITSMQPPATRARGKAPTGGQPRDTFAATDYSGSTTSTLSRVEVRDSQVDDQGRPFAGYDEHYHPNGPPGIEEFAEDDGEESGSGDEYEEGDESDDGADEQNIPQQQQHHYQQGQSAMHQQAQQATMNQQQLKRSPFDGGDSYPPTTNGGPDDEEVDEESSQAEELELLAPPQQRAPLYQQSNRHLDQLAQRPVSRHQQHPSTQKEQPLRHFPKQPQRQLVGGSQQLSLRQSPPAPKPFTQPTTHLNHAAVLENARPSSAPLPPQEVQRLVAKARPISTESAKANTVGRVPAATPEAIQEPETGHEEETDLDYDEETLRAMEYKQLRDEDYDKDPVHPTSVLPDGNTDALPERIEIVRKMDEQNQRAFFASLPLTEWEEAGDWFLSKFSEVVKKMTESRKEKRRLAIQFEEEIAIRHEYVASRKRGIDEALNEMGNSGRNVLRGSTPKRPRGPGDAK